MTAETITRPDLTQATVLLGRPGIRQDHPDYFPLVVANYILGGGSASRLYTRVREERGLAYAVYSFLSPGRYGASYAVSLQTRVDAVGEAVRLVREEMARMGQAPVAERELELAKIVPDRELPAPARHVAQGCGPAGRHRGVRARARLP